MLASRAAAQVGSTVSGTAYRAAGTVSGLAGATAADVAGFGTADVSASRRTAADVKTGYTNVVDATAGVAGDAGRAMGATAGAVASGAGGLVAAGADTAQRAGEKVAGAVDAIFTGNVDPLDTEEMAKYKYPLEYIEGSGLVYAEKLKAIGILNCQRLIKAHNTPRGRTEVAEKSGISGKLILEWVNHIDLDRINGVDSEYAILLEASGVDTVVELAQPNPANLFEWMNIIDIIRNSQIGA